MGWGGPAWFQRGVRKSAAVQATNPHPVATSVAHGLANVGHAVQQQGGGRYHPAHSISYHQALREASRAAAPRPQQRRAADARLQLLSALGLLRANAGEAFAASPIGRGLEMAQGTADFNALAHLFPKGAAAPDVKFGPTGFGGAAAYVGGANRANQMTINPAYAASMLPPALQRAVFGGSSTAGRGLYLHELAHLHTPRSEFAPRGGEGRFTDAKAEVFRVANSPRLGFTPYAVPGASYLGSAGRYLRQVGIKGALATPANTPRP